MTAGGREFQVAGAAQLKDRLPISVRLNGTSRNGTADDRSAEHKGTGTIIHNKRGISTLQGDNTAQHSLQGHDDPERSKYCPDEQTGTELEQWDDTIIT